MKKNSIPIEGDTKGNNEQKFKELMDDKENFLTFLRLYAPELLQQPIPPAKEDTDKCIHCGAKAIDKRSQVFCHKCGGEFRKNEETAMPGTLANDIDMDLLAKLLTFSDRYEITLQLWPGQTSVTILKDGVELQDYGGDFEFAVTRSIDYLKRINKIKNG